MLRLLLKRQNYSYRHTKYTITTVRGALHEEYIYTQDSPSGCVRREIPGVTQVERDTKVTRQ